MDLTNAVDKCVLKYLQETNNRVVVLSEELDIEKKIIELGMESPGGFMAMMDIFELMAASVALTNVALESFSGLTEDDKAFLKENQTRAEDQIKLIKELLAKLVG